MSIVYQRKRPNESINSGRFFIFLNIKTKSLINFELFKFRVILYIFRLCTIFYFYSLFLFLSFSCFYVKLIFLLNVCLFNFVSFLSKHPLFFHECGCVKCRLFTLFKFYLLYSYDPIKGI